MLCVYIHNGSFQAITTVPTIDRKIEELWKCLDQILLYNSPAAFASFPLQSYTKLFILIPFYRRDRWQVKRRPDRKKEYTMLRVLSWDLKDLDSILWSAADFLYEYGHLGKSLCLNSLYSTSQPLTLYLLPQCIRW